MIFSPVLLDCLFDGFRVILLLHRLGLGKVLVWKMVGITFSRAIKRKGEIIGESRSYT